MTTEKEINKLFDNCNYGAGGGFDALGFKDAVIDKIETLKKEAKRLEVIADKLLNHCDKDNGECYECSKIVCPHECELHFHHDGCPACSQDQ